jgi:hypothetical protein
MKPHKTKLLLNGVEIGGVVINAIVEASIADRGIGAYEFWGAKGNQVSLGVEEILIKSASYEPNQDELPEMTAEQWLDLDKNQDELFDKVTEAWQTFEEAGFDY